MTSGPAWRFSDTRHTEKKHVPLMLVHADWVWATVRSLAPSAIVLRYHRDRFERIATDPEDNIRWIAWRRDGRSALAVGNRGLVLGFDGQKFRKFNSPTRENLRCASYNPMNEAMIVGNRGAVLLFKNGNLEVVGVGTEANLRRVAWSPDGSTALLVGNDGAALGWKVGKTQELAGALNNLRSVSWHHQGRNALVSGNYFGTSMVPCPTLYGYEEGAKELKPLITIEKTDIIGVEWNPDGSYALAVGYEVVWHEPCVFRWTNGELENIPVTDPSLYPTLVAWDPRNNRALIGTGSPFPRSRGQGAILNFEEGHIRKLYSCPHRITRMAWHPKGDVAIIIGNTNARTFTT